ncbi:MAG: hypothetical protein QOH99_219 [Frankiaceae bacterium]|nr:hypothetical protein [Frankiaceae bacterium]
MAIAAAATGAVPLLPPLGIVLGVLSKSRLKRTGRRGLRLAEAGLVGGIIWTVVLVGAVAFLLWRDHELVAVRGDAGQVLRAGRVPTSELRAGDCLMMSWFTTPTRWVHVSSCLVRHTGEVYDVRALPSGPYPGAEGLRAAATAECALSWHDGFPASVRAAAATGAGSLALLLPTEAGWKGGDRGVACVLATPDRWGAVTEK